MDDDCSAGLAGGSVSGSTGFREGPAGPPQALAMRVIANEIAAMEDERIGPLCHRRATTRTRCVGFAVCNAIIG